MIMVLLVLKLFISRACLVPGHILPSQSVASHKSVAAIKSVAKKYKAKLWQKLATTITL
jgi:hypothetical protein